MEVGGGGCGGAEEQLEPVAGDVAEEVEADAPVSAVVWVAATAVAGSGVWAELAPGLGVVEGQVAVEEVEGVLEENQVLCGSAEQKNVAENI